MQLSVQARQMLVPAFIWLLAGALFPRTASGQMPLGDAFDNRRAHTLALTSDSVRIDTASVVPGSFRAYRKSGGDSIPAVQYAFYWRQALLRWRARPRPDTIWVEYRSLRMDLWGPVARYQAPERRFARDRRYLRQHTRAGQSLGQDRRDTLAFDPEALQRQGSITRGVTLGAGRDVSLNSNLNLQLAGPLSDELRIEAALTDNQLPVQPEGNSARIQEFDQVYIRLLTDRQRLTLGDFQARAPQSNYFLQFQKKGRGLQGQGTFDLQQRPATVEAEARLALSRGQFARNTFQGKEGNQGPYRLQGNNRELFITVLSGTERVYLNGEPLERGRDHDYVIDYNLGTITFTARQLISAYDRIVVEFQYTGQAYDRSMVHLYSAYEEKGWTLRGNYYNEQDSRNRPLFRDLTPEDLQALGSAGDKPAFSPTAAADSVGYEEGRVRYARIDTLGFDSVYVYSTDPERALYRVRFTEVGMHNGHYVRARSTANGQIFRWVSPVEGIPQGNFSPNARLQAPEKRQLITLAVEKQIAPGWKAGGEWARSTYDQNSFSVLDSADDQGMATEVFSEGLFALSPDSAWLVEAQWRQEFRGRHFEPVERYRPVEFSRYWDQQISNPDEDSARARRRDRFGYYALALRRPERLKVAYDYNRYRVPRADFRGGRHHTELLWQPGPYRFRLQSNWTDVAAPEAGAQAYRRFRRQRASAERHFGNTTAGVSYRREQNRFAAQPNATGMGSYRFDEASAFVRHGDTALQWTLRTDWRDDQRWRQTQERYTEQSQQRSYSADVKWRPVGDHRLEALLRYRDSEFAAGGSAQNGPSYTGRLAHGGGWWQRAIQTETRYELGSGQVQRNEFVYVEVAASQGVYTWNDYNGNGLQEQDEFEQAVYEGDAQYVRVVTPTNEFLPSQSHAFFQSLWINRRPGNGLFAEDRFISRWSYETTYRLRGEEVRTGSQAEFWPSPLGEPGDTQVLNRSRQWRQRLHFNRGEPVYGFSLEWNRHRRRQLLSGGFQTYREDARALVGRWNFARSWELRNRVERRLRENSSGFLTRQNYRLLGWSDGLELSWQPTPQTRLGASYDWEETVGTDVESSIAAVEHRLGSQLRWSFTGRGRLQAGLTHARIRLEGDESGSAAFQILQGLRPGVNWVINLNTNYQLNEHLYLDFRYQGRLADGRPPLHGGGMSARWAF